MDSKVIRKQLVEKFKGRRIVIVIVGFGYVSLPLMLRLQKDTSNR